MTDEALDNLDATFGPDDGDIAHLSDWEIFTKIWFSPRKIFKYIEATEYGKFTIPLVVLFGINAGIDGNFGKVLISYTSLPYTTATTVFVSTLFGWFIFYLTVYMLFWTGKVLKGKGTVKSMIRCYAYQSIPAAISLVPTLAQKVVYETEFFKSNAESYSTLFYIVYALNLIFALWGVVFSVVGLSVVQKFSIGKAILNFILATLIIIAPISLIGLNIL